MLHIFFILLQISAWALGGLCPSTVALSAGCHHPAAQCFASHHVAQGAASKRLEHRGDRLAMGKAQGKWKT